MSEEISYTYREHLSDSTCWCSPICIFNAGNDYGRVYIHRDEKGVAEDPGTEIMMVAVFKALYEDENVHIKDYPMELSYDND